VKCKKGGENSLRTDRNSALLCIREIQRINIERRGRMGQKRLTERPGWFGSVLKIKDWMKKQTWVMAENLVS